MLRGVHPGPDPVLWPRIKEVIQAPDSDWDHILLAATREVVGRGVAGLTEGTIANFAGSREFDITAPATEAARTWEGWGTALKPSWEPVLVGRKPE